MHVIQIKFLSLFLSQHRVVKLTSPNLNYVIVFGTIMLLIGNIFLPFPSRNITLVAIFCTVSTLNAAYTVHLLSIQLILLQIARIFLSIGYDICFVVALVKTMRVAYIFFKVTPTKKVNEKDIIMPVAA